MHSVELLWKTGLSVAEFATYTTHNKHKRRTFHARSGIRNHNPSNRAQKYALNRTATGIGTNTSYGFYLRTFIWFRLICTEFLFWNLHMECRPCARYSQDAETNICVSHYRQQCILYCYYYYYYYYYCHYCNDNKFKEIKDKNMWRKFYWLHKYFFFALLTDSHSSSNCVLYRSIFPENTAGYRACVIWLSDCVHLSLQSMNFKNKKTHKHKQKNVILIQLWQYISNALFLSFFLYVKKGERIGNGSNSRVQNIVP
jgi:hypothetical protein